MSNIVLESNGEDKKPTCIVLQTDMDFPEQLKVKNWFFLFSLDGKLQKAVSGVGTNDKDGHAISGSEENTPQDVNDPDVQDRARTELKFWLKTASAQMKQDLEAARQAAAASAAPGAKSGQSAKQSWSDEIH